METVSRCLWSQLAFSAHSANPFYLLAFSRQRSDFCALENARHGAWVSCNGHESISSGGQAKEAWVRRAIPHVPLSAWLTFLTLFLPWLDWSYLHSALCSAYLSKTHVLSKQLSVAISQWEAGGPWRPRALSRTEQKIFLKWPNLWPCYKIWLSWKDKVYSSLPPVCQQRTWPLQISTNLHGREPQES